MTQFENHSQFSENNFLDRDTGTLETHHQMSLFGDSADNHHEATEIHIEASGQQFSHDEETYYHNNGVNMISKKDEEEGEGEDENVSGGTKVKVLAALAVVGIATYIAYWVQEPVQLKTDVLSTSNASSETPSTSSSSGSATNTTTSPNSSEVAQIPTQNVDVSLYGFEPSNLALQKGTKVVWTNTSSEDQAIMGKAVSSGVQVQEFSSPALKSGETYSHTFTEDATLEYYSTYNPALKARIVVGNGGEASESPSMMASTTDSLAASNVAASSAGSTENDSSSNSNTSASATNSATTTPASSADIMESLNPAAPETQTTATNSDNSHTTVTSNPVTASTSVDSTTAASSTEVTTDETLKPAAQESTTKQKITSSGPEDFLYLALFLGVFYFNRRKFFQLVYQK